MTIDWEALDVQVAGNPEAIERLANAITTTPPDDDRCKWDDVHHDGQLFGVRCLRPRRRGYLWCWQHVDKGEEYLKAHQLPRPG